MELRYYQAEFGGVEVLTCGVEVLTGGDEQEIETLGEL